VTEHSDIDALFQHPLSDFTAARNSLSSRLKKAGRTAEAERVKALPKPPATAWAVNQLFWQQRKEIERLFTIGDRVREAQTGKAGDLRALLEERRRVVSDLADRAEEILRDAGHAASQSARRRMATTLESLAAWGRSNVESQAGRLTSDLDPVGFDDLAALLDGKTLAPGKVLQFRRAVQERKSAEDAAAEQAQAREAVKAAEKTVTAARRNADRAEAALAKANARAEALDDQRREIEARCKKAQEDVRTAGTEAKKAAQAVAEAERSLARARALL
jgi:hypothetical protein